MPDLTWVLSSAVLILAVIALRAAFGRRMRPGLRCALWALVLLRLLVPVQLFPAPWGVSAKLPERVAEREVYLLPVERAEHPASAVVSSGPAGVALLEDLLDERTQLTERNDETWTFTRYAEKRSVAEILQIVWLVGVGVTAAVFVGTNLRFAVRLRRRRKPLAVDCPLRVYAVEGLASSCLFGTAIYVAAETAQDERRLRHVLAHELSHRRHGDPVWTLLRCVALALHWYHPLVWWAAALSRQDSELWADTGALRQLGEAEREPYGATLIALSTGRSAKAALLCTATAMTNGKRSLKERVTMIAQRPRMTAAVVAAVTLLAALAAGCAFAGAEAKPEADTEMNHDAEPVQTSDDDLHPTEQNDLDLEAFDAALPRYQYHGEDPYLPAVCAWLVGEWEQQGAFWQTAVTIPSPLIVEVDDTDPQDIRIWGNFWCYSYQPRETTLFCVSGGERPGLLHLRTADQGYEVYDAAFVRDGTNYGPDLLRIFGEARVLKLNELDADAVRGQFIADYVLGNRLPFTQYQDYGWDPVPIPGTPETPESAQFVRFQDPAGWSIDYDLREFSLNQYSHLQTGLSGVGDLQGISILFELHPDTGEAEVLSELAEQMEQPEQKATAIGAEQTPATLLRDGATRREVIKDTYVLSLPDGGCLTVTVRNTYYNIPGDQVVPGADAVLEKTLASFRLTEPAAAESQSGNGAALTEEALEGWREALSSFQMEDTGAVTSTPVSCFFTSTYADPRDLDLAQFLAYCFPLEEPVEEEAEFESVVSGSFWEELVNSEDGSTRKRTLSDMPVPVHRYRVSRINELLSQYAGITVDDLSTDWRHDGRTIYVPEYDAFYNFTSDFGPGVFEPRSGERSGDIVTLRGDHTVLKLRVTDGGYHILSHLPIGAESTEDG